jgi:hypothetical protein
VWGGSNVRKYKYIIGLSLLFISKNPTDTFIFAFIPIPCLRFDPATPTSISKKHQTHSICLTHGQYVILGFMFVCEENGLKVLSQQKVEKEKKKSDSPMFLFISSG